MDTRRCIIGISGGSLCIRPRLKRRNLVRRKRRIVCNLSNLWNRKRRRHRFLTADIADHFSVASSIVVSFKWHRRNTAAAMARLAVLLQYGQDISIEGRDRGGRGSVQRCSDRGLG